MMIKNTSNNKKARKIHLVEFSRTNKKTAVFNDSYKNPVNDYNTPAKSKAQAYLAQNDENDGSNDDEQNTNEEEVPFYHIKFKCHKTYN